MAAVRRLAGDASRLEDTIDGTHTIDSETGLGVVGGASALGLRSRATPHGIAPSMTEVQDRSGSGGGGDGGRYRNNTNNPRDLETSGSGGMTSRPLPGKNTATTTGAPQTGFLYNRRVLLQVVCCILVLLGFGGRVAVVTLLIGLLASHAAELFRLREVKLACVWITLVALEIAVMIPAFALLRRSLFNVFLMMNIAFFIMLLGVWTSIQFSWLDEVSSFLLEAGERIVFMCLPINTSILLTWVSVTVHDSVATAPFYLLLFLAVNYWSLALPLQSSFRKYGGSSPTFVLSPIDQVVQASILLFLPSLFHIFIYHRVLFATWDPMVHVVLLMSVAVLFLVVLQGRGSLMFLQGSTPSTPAFSSKFTRVIAALALGLLVAGFEYRVVFRSYSHFIAIVAPWDVVVVSVALYSIAILGVMMVSGRLHALGERVCLVLSSLAAFTFAIVLGAPVYLWPLAGGVAACSVRFFFTRQVLHHLVASVCATVCLAWYLYDSFWFLTYEFTSTTGSGEGGDPAGGSGWLSLLSGNQFSLSQLSLALVVLFMLAMVLVGQAFRGTSTATAAQTSSAGWCMVIYTLLLAAVECPLYRHSSTIYPFAMMAATSAALIYVVNRMMSVGMVGEDACWFTIVISTSKLACALSTVEWGPSEAFFLLLPIVRVMWFHKSARMTRREGLFYAAAICVCSFVGRSLPAHMFAAMLGQESLHSTLTSSCLLGSFLLVWGLGCLPLAVKYFPHYPVARRLNTLLLTTALLVLLLQPQVGFTEKFGILVTPYRMQSTVVPDLPDSEVSHWPLWLLMTCVVTQLTALASLLNMRRSESTRLLYVLVTGISLGLFVAVVSLPPSLFLCVLYAFMFTTATAFVVFTQWPTPDTVPLMPLIYISSMTMFPIVFFGARLLELFDRLGAEREEYVERCKVVSTVVYCSFNVILAAFLKYKTTHNPAYAAAATKSSVVTSTTLGGHGDAMDRRREKRRFVEYTQQRDAAVSSPTTSHRQQLRNKVSLDMDWVIPTGNVATAVAFVLAIAIDMGLLNGNVTCVFFVSPLLLLLSRDAYLLRGLTEDNRYFPLILACSLFLAVWSLYFMWVRPLFLQWGWLRAHRDDFLSLAWGSIAYWPLLKNTLLLAMTLPSHYHFAKFLWSFAKQSGFRWLLVLPLDILPLVWADLSAIQLLACVGLVAGAVQYGVSRAMIVESQRKL